MSEITSGADTVAVGIQSFKNYVNQQSPAPSFHVDNGKEAQMPEVTYVVDTIAGDSIEGLKDCEPTPIPSHDAEQAQTPFHNGEQAYHMAEVNCAVDTITVDIEDLEDWISMPSDDDGEITHTAAVTTVADTVAVDILEGFEDCEQASIPSDDGEEAHMLEVTCAVDMVPGAVEDYEDCEQTSIRSDDGEEVSISVDPDWVSSIKKKSLLEPTRLKASPARVSCSIHRVPSWLRDYKETACSPQIISIGPFHYEKREGKLQAMEEHKWRYLRDICSREREGWLEDCLATVKGIEERARNYYSEVIPLDSKPFVEMMVLDGCFIIELFRRFCFNRNNDVLFRLAYRKKALSFDLLLLENQIPFFILERLFDLMNPSSSFPLLESALNFFFPDYGSGKDSVRDGSRSVSISWSLRDLTDRITNSKTRIRHLLHLVHTSYVLFPKDYAKSCDDPTIPCASRLKELGIRFRKRDVSDTNFLEIKFHKGVIEIPKIVVCDKTQIEFLNLIAFEQCYLSCKKYVTTYIIFMDWLINTAPDVEILRHKGIIDDYLHNDKLVASHFNNMAREAIRHDSDFYLSGVCEEINQYSKKTTPKLKASLKSYLHDYFKNPWSLVSFLAALLLLCLTIIQTFFTSFPKFAAGN